MARAAKPFVLSTTYKVMDIQRHHEQDSLSPCDDFCSTILEAQIWHRIASCMSRLKPSFVFTNWGRVMHNSLQHVPMCIVLQLELLLVES